MGMAAMAVIERHHNVLGLKASKCHCSQSGIVFNTLGKNSGEGSEACISWSRGDYAVS